jgi:hypothetical protein
MTRPAILGLFLLTACAATAQSVNSDALIIQDFKNRVAEYVKLRSSIEGSLPQLKKGESAQQIDDQSKAMAAKIRAARRRAKQGDLFTEPIRKELRRLIVIASKGLDRPRIAASLKHAEPVAPRLLINGVYPQGVPLQSTPPTLLANLPELPKEVEYRIAGPLLVLVDAKTGLVLDYMKHAIP